MFPLDYLKKCQRKSISISLINGSVCSGILGNVDVFQNLTILEATVQDITGQEKYFETTMIRGSSIKSIAMPKAINDIVKEFIAKDSPHPPKNTDGNDNNQHNNYRGNYRGGGNRGNYRGGRGGSRGGGYRGRGKRFNEE